MKTSTETVSCTEYTEIFDFELDCIARIFLPMMRDFYATEEGKSAYEVWLAEQKNEALRSAA